MMDKCCQNIKCYIFSVPFEIPLFILHFPIIESSCFHATLKKIFINVTSIQKPVLYPMTQRKQRDKRWVFRPNPVEGAFSRLSLLKVALVDSSFHYIHMTHHCSNTYMHLKDHFSKGISSRNTFNFDR